MPSNRLDFEFPISIRLAREVVERDFFVLHDTRVGNERLHYRVTVPRTWKMLDTPPGKLSEAQPIATLGVCRSTYGPPAELQVDVVYLKREVEPADWLSIKLDQSGDELLHSRTIPTNAGDIPDVLTCRTVDDKTSLHRWVAVKNGSYMFVAQARCYRQDYPTLADTLFIAASSVAFLHPREWPLSERLATFTRAAPLDFSMMYPESWKLMLDPDSGDAALSLNLLNIVEQYVVGTILVVGARSEHAPAELLRDRIWADLTTRGYAGALPQLTPASPTGSLTPRLELIAPILRHEVPHELRMSIATVAETTLLVAVVGPARKTDGRQWAVNKRAYRLVLENFNIKPVERP